MTGASSKRIVPLEKHTQRSPVARLPINANSFQLEDLTGKRIFRPWQNPPGVNMTVCSRPFNLPTRNQPGTAWLTLEYKSCTRLSTTVLVYMSTATLRAQVLQLQHNATLTVRTPRAGSGVSLRPYSVRLVSLAMGI